MLDIKRIRKDKETVENALKKRNGNYNLDALLDLDEQRRNVIQKVEDKKAYQNKVSKSIPLLKKEGKDVIPIFQEMKNLSSEISELDEEVKNLDEKIREALLEIPNTPSEEVPDGKDDSCNIEIRKYKEPRVFDFEPKAHWDLGTDLNILDFERATKITGARFSIFKGLGSRLERAIINFMLDLHTQEHGYTEFMMPALANRQAMTGTGQLPKFKEDMFHVPSKDMFLIPTAEVPLTNYRGGEILTQEELPQYYTAYTPCFRQEAGSAGRDTRGLIRNHQFDKVELVKLVEPEKSFEELEKLTLNAEEVLKRLGLAYRVIILCGGDLGFSSTKTYDIEVWMPSYGRYVEISSCSNFVDYQARRANLRYRNSEGKVDYLHTLNGSGLAVGRTFAAIIENYQNEDGSITVPEVLIPYMGTDIIK